MRDPDRRADGAEPVTKRHYTLHELAEDLDAPVEQVELWLREGEIEPIAPDRPEEDGVDTLDLLRAMRPVV